MPQFEGVWWSSAGDGPALVVPRLNVDWKEIDLSHLSERFRVVIVAPRGFEPSTRQGSYDGPGFVADVSGVLEHLGIQQFVTFGYSMNGVMAARLAVDNPNVHAVACGGFPLTADLSTMADRARSRNDAARLDPATWAEVQAAYDPDAAVAFWDDAGRLPPNWLTSLACPIRAWWGDEDAIMSSFCDLDELGHDLTVHGIEYDVLPGLDHAGTLNRLDLVLPSITTWLAEHSG